MSNWQPNWGDVVFDFATAQSYAFHCRSTAAVLETCRAAHRTSIQLHTEHWNGHRRDDFDRLNAVLMSQLVALAEHAHTVANAVDQATWNARQLQTAREIERLRWHQEQRQLVSSPPEDAD
jgi:hypothetical protein